ncbi:MAG: hypothetical protein IKB99_03140 [Lentisphaeria bacterium]|nr:hypothetical protein [Lentisphaeria bacterium]
MYRHKQICQSPKFSFEQHRIGFCDTPPDDLIEQQSRAIFHHQQAIQRLITSEYPGNVMFFTQIRGKTADIVILSVQTLPGKIVISVAFGTEKFADNTFTAFPVFININGIGAVCSENSHSFRTVTPELRKNRFPQKTEHRITCGQMPRIFTFYRRSSSSYFCC